MAAAAVRKGRALELELRDEVSARGHEERIERVLGNVGPVTLAQIREALGIVLDIPS